MKTHQHYYLIGNKIKKGGEMPLEKDYDSNAEYKHYYNLWLSSLQPCEINSYESMLINKYLLQNGFVLNNNPNPIDVTDIVEERELRTETKSGSWTDYELVFKQPKSEETNEIAELKDYRKWFFEEQERADKLRMKNIQLQSLIDELQNGNDELYNVLRNAKLAIDKDLFPITYKDLDNQINIINKS